MNAEVGLSPEAKVKVWEAQAKVMDKGRRRGSFPSISKNVRAPKLAVGNLGMHLHLG
jgi:hypothetical protein